MRRTIEILCLIFLLGWALPKFFVIRIEPWEIGVRRSLTGGIAEGDFGQGWQLRVPFFHTYYRLPGTLQYLDYSSEGGSEAEALEIRTSGNNVIFVDVTIPWHIKEDEGWQIVREGFGDSYPEKVRSTSTGILRETLADLTNLDIQDTDKRQATAASILPKLNEQLARYHIEADHVVIRAIRFRQEYEQKLQDKQYFSVQGRLDDAKRKQSIAVQETETLEKTIDKEIALKREEWNRRIEELKTKYELEIAEFEAQAVEYDRKRRAEGDAAYAELEAEGDLAEAKAEALGERLKARALASRAGRTFSAITAAENFQLGDITLNSNDPDFMQRFASMKAWRAFFLGD
jgi:regulator of protease activity HflC (stomatin/prohibitin superfamily)